MKNITKIWTLPDCSQPRYFQLLKTFSICLILWYLIEVVNSIKQNFHPVHFIFILLEANAKWTDLFHVTLCPKSITNERKLGFPELFSGLFDGINQSRLCRKTSLPAVSKWTFYFFEGKENYLQYSFCFNLDDDCILIDKSKKHS